MSDPIQFDLYHKINSIQKRYTEGPDKGRFTGEWAQPEFAYLEHNQWVWREKVDGTNCRVQAYVDPWGFVETHIGGRTANAQLHVDLHKVLSETSDRLADFALEQFEQAAAKADLAYGSAENYRITLYGEGYGAGIQKGGGSYSLTKEFILFDIQIGHFWLNEDAVTDIANRIGLERVPLVGEGSLAEAIELVSSGKLESYWPLVQPEGLVVVPSTPLFDRAGRRIITKIKGVDFQ